MFKYDVVIGKTTNNPGTTVNVNALEITFYKSEELDFGVFTIPATTRFENFQILDRVDITVTDGSNTEAYEPFLVISDEVTPVSKKGLFKHTVTFIEDIHKFEKILSSSVFFTQPLTGPKKTLLDALNHIRDVVPFERASVHAATRLFNIDTNLATFLSNIDAPQFFFNGTDLREMINSIASYVNAIGRMEDNRNLVFSFYNEILNVFDINQNVINKTLKNQTKYFTSSVESSIENAVGSDITDRSVIIYPNSDGFVNMRSTDLKVTDETFEFRLPYPIEKLNKVLYKTRLRLPFYFEVSTLGQLGNLENNNDWLLDVPGREKETTLFKVTSINRYYSFNNSGESITRNGFSTPNEEFFEIFPIDLEFYDIPGFTNLDDAPYFYEIFDVTRHMYEFNNYKQLDLDVGSSVDRRLVDLQANTLHYEINGKSLSNNRLSGVFDGQNLIESFYNRVLFANGYRADAVFNVRLTPTFNSNESDAKNNWDEQEYRFTYSPYFGTRVRLNKDDVTDHPYNTQFSANQGERIVSAERLVRNIYGMAQRLGQDEIEFKRYYTDLSEQFELGQITDDGFVIASKHITFFINYYLVTYQLSKNFNRFANRIALDQENRPFDIGRGSKTTTRNLLYNEYIELDTERKANTSLFRSPGVNVFMNTLRTTNVDVFNNPIHYAIFGGAELADTLSSEGILVNPVAFSEGNSLNFYWSFDDVIKAGDQLALSLYGNPPKFLGIELPTTNIYNNKNIRYTNNQDELENFELSFGHSLPNTNANDLPIVPIPQDGVSLIGGHSYRGIFNDSFVVRKDKSEILSMNYVVSVLPNFQYNNKIIVGRELTFSNNLIIANKNATLVVYTSISDTYNSIENLYVKGTATAHSITTTVDQESGKVVVGIPSNVLSTLKSWAIGDSDGNLYLGVNVDTDLTDTIYFNFKNKRENISYTFDDIDVIGLIAPRNLVLTPTETTIAATWVDDQVSDFYEFGIRVVLQGPGVIPAEYTSQITTNKFFTFTGLTQGFTYQVRVRSSKDGVNSFYISSTATTLSVPAKVQGFALSRITGSNNSLLGSWNAISNVTGYNAQARLASRSWETGPVLNQTLGQNQTTTTFGVGVNNIMVGRVRGTNSFGPGDFSDEDINVIPLVTGLGATALSDTVIRASWDPLTNLFEPTINQEIGFEIDTTEFTEVDSGTSTGGGTNQLSDSNKTFTPNAFVGNIIFIGSGPQAGKFATITENTATSITFTPQLTSFPQDLIGVEYSVLDLDASILTTDTVTHTAEFYDITGLTLTTFYQVGIRAYYKYIDAQFGKTVFSDRQQFVVQTLEVALPAQVLAPTVTTASGYPTQSEVRWNIFNPNNFEVSVAVDITTSATTPQSYSFTLPANSTIQRFQSGLSNNTTRVISVRFRVGTTPNFVFSNTTSNTQTTLPVPPPPVPTGLQITNITANSATASWNAVTAATNGYEVLISPDNVIFGTTTSSQSTSVNIIGLDPSKAHTAQVRSRSVDGSGASEYSAPVSFTTLSGPPPAPATATLQATGGPGWTLSWSAATGATSYEYAIATDSNFTEFAGGGTTTGTTVSGTFITGTTIYARVRSINSFGISAYKLASPTGGVFLS